MQKAITKLTLKGDPNVEAYRRQFMAEKEKLTLTGFGSFVVEKREARIGRNPRTGSQIEIPAAKVVKFRVGKTLKNAVQ